MAARLHPVATDGHLAPGGSRSSASASQPSAADVTSHRQSKRWLHCADRDGTDPRPCRGPPASTRVHDRAGDGRGDGRRRARGRRLRNRPDRVGHHARTRPCRDRGGPAGRPGDALLVLERGPRQGPGFRLGPRTARAVLDAAGPGRDLPGAAGSRRHDVRSDCRGRRPGATDDARRGAAAGAVRRAAVRGAPAQRNGAEHAAGNHAAGRRTRAHDRGPRPARPGRAVRWPRPARPVRRAAAQRSADRPQLAGGPARPRGRCTDG